MNIVKIKKADLLKVLKENRAAHRKIFEEALVGYKKKVIELLDKKLQEARTGIRVRMVFNLIEPQDQTKDYDRAIRMLEMSIEKVIELSEQDFKAYVMDDWSWKFQFLSSNSAYSSTATAMLANEPED